MSAWKGYPRRLIEVDLPIREISNHSQREKSIRHGHISTLHVWWARRPLAACRAVVCAALWPDPGDPRCPEAFRATARDVTGRFALGVDGDDADPLVLRRRLLRFISEFANWDLAKDQTYTQAARALTASATTALGGQGALPIAFDPFAGGGAIPLEASRVGAQAFASDLNPIPILLNKVALEVVPKHGQRLLDEVKAKGEEIQELAWAKLSRFYPKNPDGSSVIAWLSARTVRCEGPNCGLLYPVVGQTWAIRSRALSQEIRFRIAGQGVVPYVSDVPAGNGEGVKTSKGSSAVCPRSTCQYTMKAATIQRQLSSRRGGASDAQLLAVICRSADGRSKYARTPEDFDLGVRDLIASMSEEIALLRPEQPFPVWDSRAFVPGLYGVSEWGDMHTPRQILTLSTFADVIRDSCASLIESDPEFGKAVRLLLGLALGRLVDTSSSTCRWVPGTKARSGSFIASANGGEKHLRWITDFAESNPFSGETGSWRNQHGWVVRVIENLIDSNLSPGTVWRVSAPDQPLPDDSADLFVTDPPYGSAVPYGDLADFFYVWLRRALVDVFPDLLKEELTPKKEEAVVNLRSPDDGRGEKSESTYRESMTNSLRRAREVLRPSGIGIIVFADKRTSEWEAMLGAVLAAGWIITASWPIHTERPGRSRAQNSAALSSSIHLVCRPREDELGRVGDDVGDWRVVLRELPVRIHEWLPRLSAEGVVGADAIFSCLGPALEVFSRYSRVEKATGEAVELAEYLEYVWAAVSKEALAVVFREADMLSLESDARLSAIWLWTVGGSKLQEDPGQESLSETDQGVPGSLSLDFDTARKLAQGLGARLEELNHVVEVKGAKARLLSVGERARHLFGQGQRPDRRQGRGQEQLTMFSEIEEATAGEAWQGRGNLTPGATTLDRVHQAMLMFSAGRSSALKTFLTDEGVGRQVAFWGLCQAFSALYLPGTDEKRWVDGVLARKKSLGFA